MKNAASRLLRTVQLSTTVLFDVAGTDFSFCRFRVNNLLTDLCRWLSPDR